MRSKFCRKVPNSVDLLVTCHARAVRWRTNFKLWCLTDYTDTVIRLLSHLIVCQCSRTSMFDRAMSFYVLCTLHSLIRARTLCCVFIQCTTMRVWHDAPQMRLQLGEKYRVKDPASRIFAAIVKADRYNQSILRPGGLFPWRYVDLYAWEKRNSHINIVQPRVKNLWSAHRCWAGCPPTTMVVN